jgi:3,4-dihydroxy 2-butanone 4-phosphate synthase/GTP cyclohydrolase II
VIVLDAEDRENEGDFICAAEKVTPEIVNFMIRHGRGQLCMPILPDVAERLKLPQMCESNSAPLGTAFTIPVDHRLAHWHTRKSGDDHPPTDSSSKPSDFVRSRHLFAVAEEGGVLRRAGHTEAAVDLARWPSFNRPRAVRDSDDHAIAGRDYSFNPRPSTISRHHD